MFMRWRVTGGRGELWIAVSIALALAVAAGRAHAQAATAETTNQLIVKLRDVGMQPTQAATAARLSRFTTDAAGAGVPLRPVRSMAIGAHVMALERALSRSEAQAVAARLALHPDVEFVQPDYHRHAYRTTNDSLRWAQPYLGSVVGGINAYGAWDTTTGSPNVVVAVVDTGYRPHADLAGRILPGYDFVSDPRVANDGDGRDADASDPGDWVSADDKADPVFSECDVEDSSWHGTSVAGIIAANSNNGQWLAGIDWAAKILPVRALGKCGGNDSDIIDGVAWAAGLTVPGVPSNPYPAQIINMSLGGPGDCGPGYHSVFGAALAHGVTRAIVAAAGNDASDVAASAPASCSEVIAVAATTSAGFLADYSNFGSGVTLSAPGGTDPNSDGIALLFNDGKTTPGLDAWAEGAGTSLSAPMVSAVASLMVGLAPNLGATQLRAMLASTASSFPGGSDCNALRCGAGIVNAQAAVEAAQSIAPAPNYQGLWWNAPAYSESGWGINFAHQGDTIFASWFTYDANGRGLWLVMTAPKTGPGTYEGKLLQAHGSPFYAFNPATFSYSVVGTGTLTFGDANNGTFEYTVNGTTQTKNITRQVFGAQPACTFGGQSNLALATNYQDLWWNAPANSEPGWGVNFSHQGDLIFLTWFTYDLDGSPLWLAGTAARTTNPAVFTGTLFRTSGPRFDAFDPAKVSNVAVGSATLTFADGNDATFSYTVELAGMPQPTSGMKTITREIFAAPGTVCQ
jgi:subtilase family protein